MADITEIGIGQTLLVEEQTDLLYTLLLYRWKTVCGMRTEFSIPVKSNGSK